MSCFGAGWVRQLSSGMPASLRIWATALRISSSVQSAAVNTTDLLSGSLISLV